MAMPQKILQHIVFPENSSQQFISYTFELLLACGGFPGDVHFGRDIQEFNAVFFSQESQGNFNVQYGKALQGNFAVAIWEKVNGPYISEEKRMCLLKFHKILEGITPVIKFLEENGGLPTPTEYNGFKALEDTLSSKTASPELKASSDTFVNAMMRFSFVRDIFEKYPNAQSLPKGNIDISFRRNICHMYIEFGIIYPKMKPLLDFIEASGGWPESDSSDFPGFNALRSICSSGKITQEVMDSLESIENFISLYLLGDGLISSLGAIPKVIPHSQV